MLPPRIHTHLRKQVLLTIPFFQVGKLRLRELFCLALGHPSSQWKIQELNVDLPDFKSPTLNNFTLEETEAPQSRQGNLASHDSTGKKSALILYSQLFCKFVIISRRLLNTQQKISIYYVDMSAKNSAWHKVSSQSLLSLSSSSPSSEPR